MKYFLLKRFIRIYALYMPFLILTIFIFRVNFPDLQTILKDITLIPVFDNKTWVDPTIPVTWTLGFEIMFYLLMAIPILFSKNKHLLFSGLIILILSILGVLFHFSEVHAIFITNPLQLEFLFGMLIATLYTNQIVIKNSYVIISLIIGLGTYLFFILHGYGLISELGVAMDAGLAFKRILCWGIPSALIVFSLIYLEKNTNPRIMRYRLLILLGDSSYAIYLIHKLLFFYLFRFQFIGNLLLKLNGDALIGVLVTIAAIVGIMVHLLFEKKSLSFFTNILFKEK